MHYDQDVSMESLKQLRLKNKQEISNLYGGIDLSYNYEFIGNIFQSSKNFLSKTLFSISSWFDELKLSTPDPLPHFDKIEKDISVIRSFCKDPDNYLTYGSVMFPYMLGCDTNIKELGLKLLNVNKNHLSIVDGMLNECDLFISKVVTSEDFRKTNAPITIGNSMNMGIKFTESIDKLHFEIIKSDNHNDKIMLTAMCNNLKELDDVSSSILSLKNVTTHKEFDALLTKVEGISAKATALASDIDNGEIVCTQAIGNGIKTYLGHCANAITALSTYYYFVSQYGMIYKSISSEISNLIKK